MVTAQIIIIGDELLDGAIQDINVKPLAGHLKSLGVRVNAVMMARDHEDELLKVLKDAWQSSDLIITTGGLGPTKDDVTKLIVGRLISGKDDVNLVENKQALSIVKENYERFDKDWSAATNSYHLLPVDVQALPNPAGLAPGLCAFKNDKLLLSAPGVPKELLAMLNDSFTNKINDVFRDRLAPFKTFSVRTYGIPEEKIFFELEPSLWQDLERYGKVSSLPQSSGVDIGVHMPEDHYKRYQKELKDIFLNTSFSSHIWQFGNKSLPEFLLEQARAKGLTLACGESCTGGLAASLLTDIAGCSDVFLGSAVTYSNEAKQSLLGVQKQTLESYGAVSEEVVKEMAIAVRKEFASDLGLSFSGIAGPGGGSEEKPVGTVAIGVSSSKKTTTHLLRFKGNRSLLKQRFAMRGLFLLLKEVQSY